MKKFIFSLENVLRYKQETLGMLKNEMTQLQMKIRELEKTISGIKREYAELNHALALELKSGVISNSMAIYKRYFAELDRRAGSLELQKAAVRKTAAAKQAEIVHMKSDISGLEKLRDSQRRAYEAQGRKEQEQVLEEFVSHKRVAADCRMA